MNIKSKLIQFLLLFCCLSFSQLAAAHALRAVAQFDGKQITGMAYYSDFSVAVKTYVEVRNKDDDETITEGLTDEEGNFAIPIPEEFLEQKIDYEVIVEGEEGHRVAIIAPQVSEDGRDPKQAQQATAPNAQSSVSSGDLMQLRKDIQQLKEKLYFHDIVSGVGYILGIFGLLAFIASRRR